MRIVAAPEAFAGMLGAGAAAAVIAAGWREVWPADDVLERPISAGGSGLLDAIAAGATGDALQRETSLVTGPDRQPRGAEYLRVGRTAWVPGSLLGPGESAGDPRYSTSRGVGELIVAAVAAGATRVVVGAGAGEACDGGAGLLAALGARAVGGSLEHGGAGLAGLSRIELAAARERLAGVELVLASDVEIPLLGPRGPARGAGSAAGELEVGLTAWAGAIGRGADGRDPAVALGAGAGGGLGYALLVLGARRQGGTETVLAATDFAALVGEADLVITGAAIMDWQSMASKPISAIGRLAARNATPVIALAGRVDLARSDLVEMGLSAAYPLVSPGDPVPGGQEAALLLSELAARVSRTWGRRPR
ncbi:MAG: glycerate kinase [Candidatus Nanopelagicales bacterium]